MTVVQELTGLDLAVDRGAERLLSLQHPDGWWKGELESNATMIAQHLFLLHFLGLRDAETDRLLANELLARRRADGTWSIWFEGPADISVTVEAYAALKLAGVDAGDATRQYIRRSGGVEPGELLHNSHAATLVVTSDNTRAATLPDRTALSIVAGHPVEVHAPARVTLPREVSGPGRSAAVPGRSATVACGSRLTRDHMRSAGPRRSVSWAAM